VCRLCQNGETLLQAVQADASSAMIWPYVLEQTNYLNVWSQYQFLLRCLGGFPGNLTEGGLYCSQLNKSRYKEHTTYLYIILISVEKLENMSVRVIQELKFKTWNQVILLLCFVITYYYNYKLNQFLFWFYLTCQSQTSTYYKYSVIYNIYKIFHLFCLR